MKRTQSDDMDFLTTIIKNVNIYSQEVERSFLIEGSNSNYNRNAHVYLEKAYCRYNRYLRNIDFQEFPSIVILIEAFNKTYSDLSSFSDNIHEREKHAYNVFLQMKFIDKSLLSIIEEEESQYYYKKAKN